MTPLPTRIKWTGDGWKNNPRLLIQLKREGRIAIYAVYQCARSASEHTDIIPGTVPEGYEVIRIRECPARNVFGTPVGAHEIYPSAGEFGPYGKYVMTLERAEEIFKQWTEKDRLEECAP